MNADVSVNVIAVPRDTSDMSTTLFLSNGIVAGDEGSVDFVIKIRENLGVATDGSAIQVSVAKNSILTLQVMPGVRHVLYKKSQSPNR